MSSLSSVSNLMLSRRALQYIVRVVGRSYNTANRGRVDDPSVEIKIKIACDRVPAVWPWTILHTVIHRKHARTPTRMLRSRLQGN